MAEASKTTETVVKAVEEERVTLVLTIEEAAALYALVYTGVNGNTKGPRAHIADISVALRRAGIVRDYTIRVSGVATLEKEDDAW